METITVKHEKLDEFNALCELCHIYPKVIHVDVEKKETEFYLGAGIDIERFDALMELFA